VRAPRAYRVGDERIEPVGLAEERVGKTIPV
jgi:hypothetical protein